jgi:hypothetical protein
MTAYLVRSVNLPLLRSERSLGQAEASKLVRAWHRGNMVRLPFLAVAALALRQVGQAADAELDH